MTELRRASTVYVENAEGKVLAVSRKHDPNNFGLPGGKVDPGETDEQAAVRELNEETGLTVTNLREVFQRDDGEFICTCYVGDVSGSVHTDEEGLVKWVDREVLLRGAFGKYNERLFRKLKTITFPKFLG